MKLMIFGQDTPSSRCAVDWLYESKLLDSLVIMSKTGLSRYAWQRAGELAIDRTHYWRESLSHGADRTHLAIVKLVSLGQPEFAVCIAPRLPHDKIIKFLQEQGCAVVYGRLDQAMRVSWECA